jgi:hypothetical protein
MSQSHDQPNLDKPAPETDATDPSRRDALLRLSGYAAAMAPAMVVLVSGRATAQRLGNGNGPPCDSPAWNLGLSQAGHSGC